MSVTTPPNLELKAKRRAIRKVMKGWELGGGSGLWGGGGSKKSTYDVTEETLKEKIMQQEIILTKSIKDNISVVPKAHNFLQGKPFPQISLASSTTETGCDLYQ